MHGYVLHLTSCRSVFFLQSFPHLRCWMWKGSVVFLLFFSLLLTAPTFLKWQVFCSSTALGVRCFSWSLRFFDLVLFLFPGAFVLRSPLPDYMCSKTVSICLTIFFFTERRPCDCHAVDFSHLWSLPATTRRARCSEGWREAGSVLLK